MIQKHQQLASIRHIVPGAFIIVLFLLSIISLFSSLTLKLLLISIFVYLGLNLAVAVYICSNIVDIKLIPVMPAIFLSFHIGYGSGFLMGLVDFVILKRNIIRDVSLTR